jgi:hypothetical protein
MWCRLERARLHDIAPDAKKRFVDALDDVGAGENEVIVAPFQRLAAEVLGSRVVQLNVRSHRAVEDQNAIGNGLKVWMWFGARHGSAKKEKAQTLCAGQAL